MTSWHDERQWYNDRIVEAYLTHEIVDKHGDLIKIDGIIPHMPFFIKHGVIHYGNTPEGHTPIVIGEPLGWTRENDKLKIKFGVHSGYPIYDDIWGEIKAYGDKGALSIGGAPLSNPVVKCDEEKCWKEYEKTGIWEASWVGDHPANPGAKVVEVSMAKSEDIDLEYLTNFLIKQAFPGGFEGCVEHFMNDPDFKPRGGKTKRESAEALCAYIGRKAGKIKSASYQEPVRTRDAVAMKMYGKPFDELTDEQKQKVHETVTGEKSDVIYKPFGPWKDWDDCMKEMRQRYDEETAQKVCGKLKAKLEKGEELKDVFLDTLIKVIEMDEEIEKQAEAPVEDEETTSTGVSIEDLAKLVQDLMDRIAALEEKLQTTPEEGEETEEEQVEEKSGDPKKFSVEFKSLEEVIEKTVSKQLEEFRKSLIPSSTERPVMEKAEPPAGETKTGIDIDSIVAGVREGRVGELLM
ncbi:hypothetical protein B6U67_00805 [Methanosarcinales archaeon ex4484_138]|nr:MAG: hypothetical protein B6U67_00805 [Methanosarcinales archaeon ex4484_138]